MVDTLVSGASASRHVGSSPISGTREKSSASAGLFVLGAVFICKFVSLMNKKL